MRPCGPLLSDERGPLLFPPAMPTAALKPCTKCGVTVRDGTSRCAKHRISPGDFADPNRGSRHARGYGSAWDRRRELILRRDEGTCQPHLAEGLVHRGTHVDHKTNKAEWQRLHGSLVGCDDETNLWCVCADWHRSKSGREGAQGAGRFSRLIAQQGGVENSGAAQDGTGCLALCDAPGNGEGGVSPGGV